MLRQYIPNIPSPLHPSIFKRTLFFILSDILIIALSLYLSFLLRFEFSLADEYRLSIAIGLPFFIGVKVTAFGLFRLYRITWRHVGINELFNIVNALIVAQLVLIVIFLVPSPLNFLALAARFSDSVSIVFPRSIFLIDWVISIIAISGLRISKRFYLEIVRNKRSLKQGARTLIIGAGDTGEMVLRDMAKQEFSRFYPIGMLDDDGRKVGTYIHGVKVLSKTDRLRSVVKKHAAEALIIAIPSLNHKDLRRIYDDAKGCGIETIKIVPRIYDFHRPEVNLKSLEEISIEDIIGRQTIKVEYDEIGKFFNDRTVLITGGGGSIGSEIVMQVCSFYPKSVVLFDIDETALHNMSLKLEKLYPELSGKILLVVGDVRDSGRVEEVFEMHSPQIVFHAAAYKHVPMMEYNPSEAVKVNILGTYNLAEISVKNGVKKFIMISTDKAVRPTSVMGATKRVAEDICKALNKQPDELSAGLLAGSKKTEFISVRFGNVLGSRGSVLPLFMEQLKHGGPLTVTHKDMTRYFMTIPEAVSLVLQASVIGKGGEILVLDMGEPVRIVELAEELIKIHGLTPYQDIDITFVGLRPGEKLFEELMTTNEENIKSKHERIFITKNEETYTKDDAADIIEKLHEILKLPPADKEIAIRNFFDKHIRP